MTDPEVERIAEMTDRAVPSPATEGPTPLADCYGLAAAEETLRRLAAEGQLALTPGEAGLLVAELDRVRGQRDDLRDRVASAESALARKGYRRSCDIPQCNCGDSWTHGGYADTRLRELLDAQEEE